MTRDEFIAAFLDEENAATLRAHAEAVDLAGQRLSDEHHVRLGRATMAALRRNRDRLGRMYDALHPRPADRPAPGPRPASADARRTA